MKYMIWAIGLITALMTAACEIPGSQERKARENSNKLMQGMENQDTTKHPIKLTPVH